MRGTRRGHPARGLLWLTGIVVVAIVATYVLTL